MLVDLGRSVRKRVRIVEEGMRERQLDEGGFGIDAAHELAERLVHSEIVVRPEKAALVQVPAKRARLLLAQLHVSVPGDEEHRVVPEVRIGGGDDRLLLLPHAHLAPRA